MNEWLEYPNTSNRLKQTYILGFLDVSGGDIINRNGNFINNGNTILKKNLYVLGDSLFIGEIITNDISINGNVVISTGNLQYTLDNLQNQIDNLTTTVNNNKILADASINFLTDSINTVYNFFFRENIYGIHQ